MFELYFNFNYEELVSYVTCMCLFVFRAQVFDGSRICFPITFQIRYYYGWTSCMGSSVSNYLYEWFWFSFGLDYFSLEVNNNVYILFVEAGMKMLNHSYGFSIAKMVI